MVIMVKVFILQLAYSEMEVFMFFKFITIRVKGYAGPGWEIECTGPRKWVEKTIKKYIPKVKRIALNIFV